MCMIFTMIITGMACDNNCLTCETGNLSECITCNENFGFDSTARTCTVCVSGEFSLGNTNICAACSTGCSSCTATTSTACTACSPQYAFSTNSCAACSGATYSLGQTASSCSACPLGCTACTSSSLCSSCDLNYGFSTNACSQCPSG